MSGFDPFGPGNAPRIEHAIIDEETQMMRYLAEIAMADLELLPPESARRVRPDSLLAAYRTRAASRLIVEEENSGTADNPLPDSVSAIEVSEFIKPEGGDEVSKLPPTDPVISAAFSEGCGANVKLIGVEDFDSGPRTEFTFDASGRIGVVGIKFDAKATRGGYSSREEAAAVAGKRAADWAARKKVE